MIGVIYNILLYQILSYIITVLITILVYLFFSGRFSFIKKSKEPSMATKKEIYNFLKLNASKAYTAEMILNKISGNIKNRKYRKFIKKNYEKILSEMHSDQIIELTQKNGQIYYIFPSM